LTGITSAGFFTTTPLRITVNPSGLANGTYTTYVRVYAQGYSDATSGVLLQVTLIVGATGVIETSVSSLSFAANVNGSNPANQTFNVSTTLTSAIVATTSVSYTNGSGWLTVNPASGTVLASAPLLVTVGASVSGLLAGTYNATIAVASGSATRNVTVQLVVSPGAS